MSHVLRISICLATMVIVAIVVSNTKGYFLVSNEGYNFSPARDISNPGRGPEVGQKIKLGHLKGPAEEIIERSSYTDLMILAIVDPDCAASRAAKEQLMEIRSELTAKGFGFYLVSFTFQGPKSQFFEFAHSYDKTTPAYLWDFGAGPVPEGLQTMVVPSCLLVSNDGTILRTFPGTSKKPEVRSQIAKQVINESLQEIRAKL